MRLQYGQTLNLDHYSKQVERFKLTIDKKLPELVTMTGVVLRQDNARPCTSIVICQILRELGRKVLRHPPYSLEQFQAITMFLMKFVSDKKLVPREDCENPVFDLKITFQFDL